MESMKSQRTTIVANDCSLSEAGVRFNGVNHRYWDQHYKLKDKHTELATEVGKPIAGLPMDLKQLGL